MGVGFRAAPKIFSALTGKSFHVHRKKSIAFERRWRRMRAFRGPVAVIGRPGTEAPLFARLLSARLRAAEPLSVRVAAAAGA